jgi:hypothetical protein
LNPERLVVIIPIDSDAFQKRASLSAIVMAEVKYNTMGFGCRSDPYALRSELPTAISRGE